jgi:hypothetical protein
MKFKCIASQIPGKSFDETNDSFEAWNDLVTSINTASPDGFNNMWQGAFWWNIMNLQLEFVVNALEGILISLLFAFIVLCLATMNIVVASFATLAILMIIISVMAQIVMSGWNFGITESISVVIVVGFSVDYTVHLGSHYVHSPFQDKYRRTRFALSEMGVSIIGGAITTMGSAIFLIPCLFVIFDKMAFLILGTIGFSLFYSLVFFVMITHLIGPQKEFASLNPLKRKLIGCCRNLCKKGDASEAHGNKIDISTVNNTTQN